MLEILEAHPTLLGLGLDGAVGQDAGRAQANETFLDHVELARKRLFGLVIRNLRQGRREIL